MAELTTRREFWSRIDRGDARFVFVAVLNSWQQICDTAGEEAADIAVDWFLDVCRFATADAGVEARLSQSVFAAYWQAIVNQRQVDDVMRRWFPMEVKTPHAKLPIQAAWFIFETSPAEDARALFDRISPAIGDEALPRGWDGQVG